MKLIATYEQEPPYYLVKCTDEKGVTRTVSVPAASCKNIQEAINKAVNLLEEVPF